MTPEYELKQRGNNKNMTNWFNQLGLKRVLGHWKEPDQALKRAKTLGKHRGPLKYYYGPRNSFQKVFESGPKVDDKLSNRGTTMERDERPRKKISYACTTRKHKVKRNKYEMTCDMRTKWKIYTRLSLGSLFSTIKGGL